MIKEQASRTAFVREKGWDASTYEEQSKLLLETRHQYQLLLRELLGDEPADDSDSGEAPAASPDDA